MRLKKTLSMNYLANANNLGYDNSDYDSYLVMGFHFTLELMVKKRKNIIRSGGLLAQVKRIVFQS